MGETEWGQSPFKCIAFTFGEHATLSKSVCGNIEIYHELSMIIALPNQHLFMTKSWYIQHQIMMFIFYDEYRLNTKNGIQTVFNMVFS